MNRLINYCFGTPENGYNPPLLKSNFLVIAICFLLLSHLVLEVVSAPRVGYADDLTAANILAAVNRERSSRNLTTLTENSMLNVAAQYKSGDMVARHYFSHTDPEGNYIWSKIVAAGYTPYLQLGENLAIEFYNTDSLVSAWMNSPTHRANVLNEGFRDQGMGTGFGDVQQGQYYSAITNTFGTLIPKKIAVTAPVAVVTPPAKTSTPKQPKTTAPKSTTKKDPSPTSIAIAPTSKPKPVSGIRGVEETAYAMGSSTATGSVDSKKELASALAVVSTKPLSTATAYKVNRAITLGVGILLLLIMLGDLKLFIEKKLTHLDKKVNNLVLLLMSLLAIAFVYLM